MCIFHIPSMTTDHASAPKGYGWLHALIAIIIAFDAAALFQWADGALKSEFGAHPEEARNYLAGVHARDSFRRVPEREGGHSGVSVVSASGQRRGFLLLLGGWMTVAGTSRIAVMLLMTTLAACTATLIFCAVRRELGGLAAGAASLLWLSAPAVRGSYETIMPEQFSAFVLTGAALLWARMMDETDIKRAAAAKWIGNAALLAVVAVLGAAFMSVVKVGPGDSRAASLFLRECVSVSGVGVLSFAIVGMALRSRSEVRMSATWTALSALVAGVLFSRWMKSDIADVRVLIIATPALAMLAARGAIALASVIVPRAAPDTELPRRCVLWIILLLLLALPSYLLSPWQKDWHGFGQIAASLIETAHGPARVLVVSDPRGEGMLLSELAMRDRARKITIERGSETLVESVNGSDGPKVSVPPAERFHEDEQLFADLTSGRIAYIVLDSAVPIETRAGYHDQLRRVIEDNVRIFWPIADSPFFRDGEPMGHPLRIFRVMQMAGAELR